MSAASKGSVGETGTARRRKSSARPNEDEALEAFAKALHNHFDWREYPLLLHWCKVLHMTGVRERLIDLAFAAPKPDQETRA
ncbi:hypothetical protein WCLP8_4820006 [uncultured Gammaproteobacteria bacterium]